MRDNSVGFLGRGWQFPPQFDLYDDTHSSSHPSGDVAMASGDNDIQQSLAILFSTLRGERIMTPDFGLGLHAHVFDPVDETELGNLRSQIEDAVLFFEPRIKIEDIEFDTTDVVDGCLKIALTYWVPAINSRSNMVYPFYFREGTNISAG